MEKRKIFYMSYSFSDSPNQSSPASDKERNIRAYLRREFHKLVLGEFICNSVNSYENRRGITAPAAEPGADRYSFFYGNFHIKTDLAAFEKEVSGFPCQVFFSCRDKDPFRLNLNPFPSVTSIFTSSNKFTGCIIDRIS